MWATYWGLCHKQANEKLRVVAWQEDGCMRNSIGRGLSFSNPLRKWLPHNRRALAAPVCSPSLAGQCCTQDPRLRETANDNSLSCLNSNYFCKGGRWGGSLSPSSSSIYLATKIFTNNSWLGYLSFGENPTAIACIALGLQGPRWLTGR